MKHEYGTTLYPAHSTESTGPGDTISKVYKPRVDDVGLYTCWQIVFLLYTIANLVFIGKDWIEDIVKFSKRRNNQFHTEENSNTMGQLILSNMMDFVLLFFMIVVLGHKPDHLWWILFILFILIILRECFQMAVSLRRYITSWENFIEFGAIILVGILLFNDDSNLDNRKFNRNVAAFAIVLSWSELITLAARHPRLTR